MAKKHPLFDQERDQLKISQHENQNQAMQKASKIPTGPGVYVNGPGAVSMGANQPAQGVPFVATTHTHANNPSVTYQGPNAVGNGSGYSAYTPNVIYHPSPIPADGLLINIEGKVYRFAESSNSWHEVVDAVPEVKSAPAIPIELDAKDMLSALKKYHEFLEDIEDLDAVTAQIVDDTMFGLRESIEALEKLG